ncbi:protein-disulfide reductase DsbD domain-containing protein [Roseovarius sp. EL26]|uniref:protein-disulfide reductase DsbD domain-containing protein n=1 Tax=Roseovarius sp. EL26 TaxID=2126672 RepID=UPI0020B12E5F|nr:protein-disulfide reductase DsbD domain-containing protein [Roseovarius sp. EL26]
MRFVFSLCVALCSLLPMLALAGPADDIVDARILPGWRGTNGQHTSALQLTLKDGWKTYWRAPGDAGIPPRFNWQGSQNLAGVEVVWPAPIVFNQSGLQSLGYKNVLVLPLKITPKRAGKAISLDGKIEIGVCQDICVPVSLKVSQELPQQAGKRDPRIVAALAEQPYSAREAGVSHVSCQVTPVQNGIKLNAKITLPRKGKSEFVAIEAGDPKIWVAQAETMRRGQTLYAETTLYHADSRPFALNRSDLRITVIGGKSTVDIQGCPAG